MTAAQRATGPEVRTSPFSYAESFQRLLEVIASRNLHVLGIIDHAALAHDVGMTLRNTRVVMFGNPAAGTPLMETHPVVALDLPLRVLVWEFPADGATYFGYWPAECVARRFGIGPASAHVLSAPSAIVAAVIDSSGTRTEHFER